jgi:outer membrane protein OmpA-like peptidoglycan-associated protein
MTGPYVVTVIREFVGCCGNITILRRNSGQQAARRPSPGELSPRSLPSTFRADSFQEGAMKMSLQRAILLVMCCAAMPHVAQAADSTLVLVMGGEAYDGPPKFEVDFAGKLLGGGSVAAAIDTAEAGRFADQSDKTPYVQSFTFAIPEDVFQPDGLVTVRFLNEAYGGEGSGRDRNLFLASVTLNGRAITASGLSTREGRQPVDNEMLGEFLVIPDGSKNAVTEAPNGGWPLPLLDIVQPVARKVTITDSDPSPAAAPSLVAEIEPVETAMLDPDPEASSMEVCDLDEKYNVIGFNSNSNELTPKLIERLNQVAADIGQRQCNVTVTGYSSKQGSIASNALFAIERAQNSLRYLQEKGVKFIKASATGVGATDEFGPDFASNRRVVITVTP